MSEALDTRTAVINVPAEFAWIAHCRRWVTGLARDLGVPPESEPVLALLTSEVVTNAIEHGPRDGTIEVSAALRGPVLRVTVHDESPVPPEVQQAGRHAPGGRGMFLVDRLALAWGTDISPAGGKSVWFDVQAERPA